MLHLETLLFNGATLYSRSTIKPKVLILISCTYQFQRMETSAELQNTENLGNIHEMVIQDLTQESKPPAIVIINTLTLSNINLTMKKLCIGKNRPDLKNE